MLQDDGSVGATKGEFSAASGAGFFGVSEMWRRAACLRQMENKMLVRSAVRTAVAVEPPKPGNILATVRRSPLVGADLDLSRPREDGRKVDL
jgi:hypothetical protein